MTEQSFNKIFSTFILVGMSIAVVLATIFKINGADARGTWLVLSSAFGSLMGVAATVAAANGKIITFLFGFLDVSLYGVVCLVNWKQGGPGLGNAILHFVYFVPMQFVGFWQWKHRNNQDTGKVKPRMLTPNQILSFSVIFLVASVVFYFILAHFDKSAASGFIKVAVVLDVLPLVCNIIGQYLMSNAYLEQWVLWMGVNVFSIIMWSVSLKSGTDASYALIYIIKYVFYLINSVNGLRVWIKLHNS